MIPITVEGVLLMVKGVEKIVDHFKQRAAAGQLTADDGHVVTEEEFLQHVASARVQAQGLASDGEASLKKRHPLTGEDLED